MTSAGDPKKLKSLLNKSQTELEDPPEDEEEAAGAVDEDGAADDDSHATGLLEQALYTRPLTYRGLAVPAALLSGNHAEIERWRRRDAIRRTWQRRPDLLLRATLSEDERYFLAQLAKEDMG